MNAIMGLDITDLLAENQRLREENRALREENLLLREENQSLRELVARQQEQIAELVKRVATLEERLQKNSSNSSKPPSQDPPSVKRPKKPATGRSRGGQVGHTGIGRKMLPLDQVDHVVEVKPEVCQGCGVRLEGEDEQPGRHQVVELPVIRPEVTEYRIHELICSCCGERNIGTMPGGVPTGTFGVRLIAVVAMLTGVYRISRRKVKCLLSELFGVEMGTGSVSACEKQVSRSLETPVEEVLTHVREQPALNVDETSWRESGRKAWLWVATSLSGLVTVFMIHANRSQEAARSLLGAFAGILISDRYSAYTPWSLDNRQVCWSHLRRDFKAMSERSGDAGRIGLGLFEASHQLFEKWHRFREGLLEEIVFREEMRQIQASVEALLREGSNCSDEKMSGKCASILSVAPALWTFVRIPGVEPTNNAAERAVRHGVLWRKGSFGSDSPAGSRFAERIMTVFATCRQQNRNVMAFLIEAVEAGLRDKPAPSLLPSQEVEVIQPA